MKALTIKVPTVKIPTKEITITVPVINLSGLRTRLAKFIAPTPKEEPTEPTFPEDVPF